MKLRTIYAMDLRFVHKYRKVYLPFFNMIPMELVAYHQDKEYAGCIKLTFRDGITAHEVRVMKKHEIMVVM